MDNLLAFLAGGSLIAFFLTEVIKKWVKSFIVPRFGDLGIHLTVLAISLILALGYYLWQNVIPQSIVAVAGSIFGGAVLIYNVLYKSIVKKALLGSLDKGE